MVYIAIHMHDVRARGLTAIIATYYNNAMHIANYTITLKKFNVKNILSNASVNEI